MSLLCLTLDSVLTTVFPRFLLLLPFLLFALSSLSSHLPCTSPMVRGVHDRLRVGTSNPRTAHKVSTVTYTRQQMVALYSPDALVPEELRALPQLLRTTPSIMALTPLSQAETVSEP